MKIHSQKRYDVLVIGAGPAGTTAAILLAKAGWTVAIVEQSPFPRRKVCGEFISATSFPLLAELAVADTFFDRAGPEVQRVGLFAGHHALFAPMPRMSGGLGPWGRALGREHLDLLLLDAARRAGAEIRQPCTATALTPELGGWSCQLSSEKADVEIHAKLIIAASGSWGRGRPFDLPRRDPAARDLFGFKVHFRDCDLPSDLMPLLIFEGGYGGMVHSDSERVSLSCCIRRDRLAACRQRASSQHAGEAVFHHILASCAPVRDITARASLSGAWLSAGPIRPGFRHAFEGGLFRIGNLASEAHPIIAEGISMAMQSAALLCQALIADPDAIGHGARLAAIGRSYDRYRKARFGLRIHLADALAQLAQHPSSAGLLVRTVDAFPKLLSWGATLSGKVSVHSAAHGAR